MAETQVGDEARELDRLRRFSSRPGPRFGLGLAIVRDPVVARELRAQLEQALVDVGVRVATVTLRHEDEREDLVSRMIAASEGVDALFVVGLERLLVDAAGRKRETPAIANLNQRRDSLPELLDVRVVFWLARDGYASFCDQAWDLRQFMLTVAEFERTAKIVALGREVEELPEWFQFVDDSALAKALAQAEGLARAAEAAEDSRTSADAAVSAAQAYVGAAHFDDAVSWLERAAAAYEQVGDLRSRAVTVGKIADILGARGELNEALRIRREEELPIYEQLGDVRWRAMTLGKVADILERQSKLDEALRIRREEQLPVFERLGDVRERAVTMGQVADILERQGKLDEALRIRREQELPVYERLGDVRARATSMGKVADILEARGELDEALRIRREQELPVYELLGDTRSLVRARVRLALILIERKSSDADRAEAHELIWAALGDARRLGWGIAVRWIETVVRQLGEDPDAPPFV